MRRNEIVILLHARILSFTCKSGPLPTDGVSSAHSDLPALVTGLMKIHAVVTKPTLRVVYMQPTRIPGYESAFPVLDFPAPDIRRTSALLSSQLAWRLNAEVRST